MPHLIFLIGIVVASTITVFIDKKADEQIVTENQREISELEQNLKLAFKQYLHPLAGNAAIYQLQNYEVTPQEFRKVSNSRNLYKDFKGAIGFGFIRKIKATDINNYLKKQKKIDPNFALKRLNQNTSQIYSKDYFVIEVVEPIEVNQKAIGLVVSDEKNRFEAAEKAMIEGVPALTKSIKLVQDNTKVPGFLMYYPIYTQVTPPTTEEDRIEQFVGWTYAPILSSAIFEFVKKLNQNLPPIKIYEQATNSELFQNPLSQKFHLDSSHIINILGNNWVIKYDQDYSPEGDVHHYALGFLFLLLVGFFSFISYYLFKKQAELIQLEADEINSKRQIQIITESINNQRLFFKKTLDSIPSLVGYWDKNLNNIFCNATYTDFYGKLPEEIYGNHISSLLPKDIYELNLPYLKQALQGEMQVFRRRMTNIRGEVFEVNAKYIPDFQNDEVVGIFVIVEDITAFVQKEDQVQMLLEVIEFAPVAIEITDKNNIIEYVNQFHVKNTGYSKEESIGFSPSKFASGKTPKKTYEELQSKLREHTTWTGEFINCKRDGEEYIEQATISTILNEKGEVSHYVAIKQDITEQKKTESQLMFNSKLATLGEMAAGVAHEINNPLSIIQMSVDSIGKKLERQVLLPENLIDTLKKISTNTDRIARIVKSLKLYTRNTNNDEFKMTYASTILNSVIDLCSEKIKYKDIKFEIANYDDFEIECNDIKIQQVLVNLINNSSEAIEENSLKWIRIVVERDLHNAYFKVLDSGTINDQTAEKMFNPFFTTKPTGKGTGLGLSISLNIAKEHHGNLYLDKNYSNTCFILKIPKNHIPQAESHPKIAS